VRRGLGCGKFSESVVKSSEQNCRTGNLKPFVGVHLSLSKSLGTPILGTSWKPLRRIETKLPSLPYPPLWIPIACVAYACGRRQFTVVTLLVFMSLQAVALAFAAML
jgi:hypothetical protein